MSNRKILTEEEVTKYTSLKVGNFAKVVFGKNSKVSNVGRIVSFEWDDRSKGVIVMLQDNSNMLIGYDLDAVRPATKREAGNVEAVETPEEKKKRLRKLERDAKRKARVAKKAKVSETVERNLDLENMKVTLPGTRNFNSGTYDIVWPDVKGKSRKECAAELKEFEADPGMKLVVVSWNKGEAHFVIEVPEVKGSIDDNQDNDSSGS